MFWDKFVKLCSEHNTKPNPVAAKLGLSSGSVTNWKNGATPNSVTVQKIADYFDVPVDYLLGNTDEKNPPAKSQGDTVALHITDFHGQEPEVIEISREKFEKIQKILKIMEDEQDKEAHDDSRIF